MQVLVDCASAERYTDLVWSKLFAWIMLITNVAYNLMCNRTCRMYIACYVGKMYLYWPLKMLLKQEVVLFTLTGYYLETNRLIALHSDLTSDPSHVEFAAAPFHVC
jgi:hypothetical protein